MLCDSLFLRYPQDYDKLRKLGMHFAHLFSTEELDEFNTEIEILEKKTNLAKIMSSSTGNNLRTWLSNTEFPKTVCLVRCLHALSYSSASVERVFSKMLNTQTPHRNRLSVKNLESCLLLKETGSDRSSREISPQTRQLYLELSRKISSNNSAELTTSQLTVDAAEEQKNDASMTEERPALIQSPVLDSFELGLQLKRPQKEELGIHSPLKRSPVTHL